MIETKSLATGKGSVSVSEASNGVGLFSGYAATYGNIDRDFDIIEKGAFPNYDEPKSIRLLWAHSMSEPIGIWKSIKSDDTGLKVEGELNLETRRGKEAYSLLKQGALDSMSIGFKTKKSDRAKMTIEGESKDVRRIKSIELYEISLVAIPANPMARIGSIKSMSGGGMPSEREFEEALRDAGFTQKQAKAIIAKGFRTAMGLEEDDQRDADLEAREIAEVLKSFTASL
ncbi:MAG: HK97 family phage prohead protease [Beijerinckiaceae bacterium]